jgi:hypothetical protein
MDDGDQIKRQDTGKSQKIGSIVNNGGRRRSLLRRISGPPDFSPVFPPFSRRSRRRLRTEQNG